LVSRARLLVGRVCRGVGRRADLAAAQAAIDEWVRSIKAAQSRKAAHVS
jgi:hypothetical protein